MGRKPFEKGDWVLQNKHERFKHFRFQRDQKALRELRLIKKRENQQSYNATETSSHPNEWESSLFLPKAFLKKSSESNELDDQLVQNETSKYDDNDKSNDILKRKESSIKTQDGEKKREKQKKLSKIRTGLGFRFKKELQIADAKKQEKEVARGEKDAAIKARQQFLRGRRQERCKESRLLTHKTRKGQPKMESVIQALTTKILKTDRT